MHRLVKSMIDIVKDAMNESKEDRGIADNLDSNSEEDVLKIRKRLAEKRLEDALLKRLKDLGLDFE